MQFMQSQAAFIGRQIFPMFFSGLQAANYYVFDRENLLNVPRDIQRAPSSPYKRISMQLSGDAYACQNYGVESPIDDEEREKYANAFDADNAGVNKGVITILTNHELRVRDKIYGAGNIPTSTPGTKWDQANSTPIQDVRAMKESVFSNCGLEANLCVINRSVLNTLEDHEQFLSRIKYSQLGILTVQLLQAIFGIERVVVAGGLTNAAAEGLPVNPSSIWGDTVIVAHVENAQDLKAPNFGRTFAWSKFTGPEGVQTFSYREDGIDSDVHRVKQHVDEKLTGPGCGYTLTDVLS